VDADVFAAICEKGAAARLKDARRVALLLAVEVVYSEVR
jgi:hypothetical protein